MFFLLRLLFWFALVLYFLPIGVQLTYRGHIIDLSEATKESGKTVKDIVGLCGRNPDLCNVGTSALSVVSEQARKTVTPENHPRPDAPVVPIPTERPKQIRP
ncbi:MAG: DUF5330 domain-containing protein [Mesorhizobium sp.]